MLDRLLGRATTDGRVAQLVVPSLSFVVVGIVMFANGVYNPFSTTVAYAYGNGGCTGEELVFEWSLEPQLRSDRSDRYERATSGPTVQPGTYEVFLTSGDNNRQQMQDKEQWFLKIGGTVSASTPDLPDNANANPSDWVSIEYNVGRITVHEAASTAVARHTYAGHNVGANSISPAKARLISCDEPEPPPPPPVASCSIETQKDGENPFLYHTTLRWENLYEEWFLLYWGDEAETGADPVGFRGPGGSASWDHVYNPGTWEQWANVDGPGGSGYCTFDVEVTEPEPEIQPLTGVATCDSVEVTNPNDAEAHIVIRRDGKEVIDSFAPANQTISIPWPQPVVDFAEHSAEMSWWIYDEDGLTNLGTFGPCGEEEPEKKVVIPMMWLLTGPNVERKEPGIGYAGAGCVLISETHPSVERQNQACFPTNDPGWTATNAPCAGPVYDNGTEYGEWACDDLMRELGLGRLPLFGNEGRNLWSVYGHHLAVLADIETGLVTGD